MKYKEMLRRKGDKNSDGASTGRKSDQAGAVEFLMTESGKGKYSDA